MMMSPNTTTTGDVDGITVRYTEDVIVEDNKHIEGTMIWHTFVLYIDYILFTNTQSVQNDNNQIDDTAEVIEKKDTTTYTEINIPLQQVPTLVYQSYTQMVPPLFQPFIPIYPIIQPFPIIHSVPKRAKRTCMKCLKTTCTGARTRVKKGEHRMCSTFNILLD